MAKTTKDFNLEMVKNGKAIQTKLGNPVKFICITNDGKLLVKVNHRSRVGGFSNKYVAPMLEGTVEKYLLNGKKYNGTTTEFDLEMVDAYIVMPARNEKGQFIKKN